MGRITHRSSKMSSSKFSSAMMKVQCQYELAQSQDRMLLSGGSELSVCSASDTESQRRRKKG